MGLFDGLLGKKGQAPAANAAVEAANESAPPMYSISTTFNPVRLSARKEESVELVIDVKNIGETEAMTSVNVDIPKGIGFDGMGITRTKEYRVGMLKPGEEKKFSVSLHGSSQTTPGNYRITIGVYSHYRDYSHVLNAVKKAIELRVI